MIILTTSANQTFSIIPTEQVDLSGNTIALEFTNETTKEVITRTATTRSSVNDIYYLSNNNLSFLKEDTYYALKVYFNVSGVVIYRDQVFVTNQSISAFTINNGEYTLPTINNNSYITL